MDAGGRSILPPVIADRIASDDRWSSAWALTIAAFLIGFAIQLDFGRLDPGAILLLSLALPFAILGVVRPAWSGMRERSVRFALTIMIIAQFGLLIAWPPGASPAIQDAATLLPLRLGLIAAGAVAVMEMLDRRALSRVRMPLLFAFWGVVAAWVVLMAPLPPNDVWWFQQAGSQALLDGINPYSIQMPNIYAPDSSLYAPGSVLGDRLDFGLPYPPLSLFLGLPGFALLGDVRFAHLATTLAAAGLMATMRPGLVARGAALLFLFTPRSFFVIEQGWTDPQTVLAVALVAWLAVRRERVLAPVLGLGVAVKQHMALLLPLSLLLLPRPLTWRRGLGTVVLALVAAAVVTAPLALWDLPGFWRSVVALQLIQPFRPDSLSYLAWLGLDDPRLALIGFASLIPIGVLVAWRGARTPAGFAAAAGLAYLFLVAFNKQAFANYYYLVIGAMCCSIAATRPAPGLPPSA